MTGRAAATDAEARALASSVRIKILRMCLNEPLTNKEIAVRLDANPATVLHHVRKLVATGFLEAQEERSGSRGAREVPYLATRKSWRLKLDDSDPVMRSALLDAFVSEINRLSGTSEVKISRLGMRLTETEHAELLERLNDFLEELSEREPSPDGEQYSIFLAIHSDPWADESNGSRD